MSAPRVLFGFHAVGVRLKTAPQSIVEIYYEPTRRVARLRQFLERAKEANVRLIEADGLRLAKLAGSHGLQGGDARGHALVAMAAGQLGQPQAVGFDQPDVRFLGPLEELPHPGVLAGRVGVDLDDGLGRGLQAHAHGVEPEQDFG